MVGPCIHDFSSTQLSMTHSIFLLLLFAIVIKTKQFLMLHWILAFFKAPADAEFGLYASFTIHRMAALERNSLFDSVGLTLKPNGVKRDFQEFRKLLRLTTAHLQHCELTLPEYEVHHWWSYENIRLKYKPMNQKFCKKMNTNSFTGERTLGFFEAVNI